MKLYRLRPSVGYSLFYFFLLQTELVQSVLQMSELNSLYGGDPSRRCKCTCGLNNRKYGRLIGGVVAEFNEYPWVTALLYKGHYYCAGTLINDRYVLTAAHCIRGVNVVNLKALLGEHIRSFPIETHTQYYSIVYSVYHHLFNHTTYNNDIGLLKLGQVVEYMWYSRPACLPWPDTDYVGEVGVVAGWGKEGEEEEISDSLNEILVPVYSNEVCRKKLKFEAFEITDNMMCAGYSYGEVDSCHGDSGGGLMWEGTDSKTDVIGIVSWGHGCGRPGYPGVYTRVTKYLKWIAYHTRDSCYCGRRSPRG